MIGILVIVIGAWVLYTGVRLVEDHGFDFWTILVFIIGFILLFVGGGLLVG